MEQLIYSASLPEILLLDFLRRMGSVLATVTLLYFPFYVFLAVLSNKITPFLSILSFVDCSAPTDFLIAETPLECETVRNLVVCYHLMAQLVLLIGTFVADIALRRIESERSPQYLNRYAIEFGQLPPVPTQVLIPSLIALLQKQIDANHHLLVEGTVSQQILDIQSSLTQDQINLSSLLSTAALLRRDLVCVPENTEMPLQYQSRLKDIELQVKQRQILSDENLQKHPRFLWLVLRSVQQRDLLLSFISKSTEFKLLCTKIEAREAPYPGEINWSNIYHSKARRVVFRLTLLCLSGVAICLFDWLIYFLKGQEIEIPFGKAAGVLVLESILKELVINFTREEHHTLSSREELSLLWKVSVMFSANLGFLSLAGTDYSMQAVRVAMLQLMAAESGYKVFCIYITSFKDSLIAFLGFCILNKHRSLQELIEEFKNTRVKRKVSLAIVTANLLPLFIVGVIFALLLPSLYPLLTAFAFAAYFSHRRFFQFYCQPIPYSTTQLTTAAFRFIYVALTVHLTAFAYSLYGSLFLFVPIVLLGIGSVLIALFCNRFPDWRDPLPAGKMNIQLSGEQIASKVKQIEQRMAEVGRSGGMQLSKTQEDFHEEYLKWLRSTRQKFLGMTPSEASLLGAVSYIPVHSS